MSRDRFVQKVNSVSVDHIFVFAKEKCPAPIKLQYQKIETFDWLKQITIKKNCKGGRFLKNLLKFLRLKLNIH